MCLHSASPLPVPGDTAHVARLAFPHGNLLLSLRDKLGPIFDDGRFAHLFPAKGQPAEAPWRLALVTLLQFAEELPDRQAAVRCVAGSTGSICSACHLLTPASTARC